MKGGRGFELENDEKPTLLDEMKVLIICEKFAPENTVGAIRMSKVAKYLKINYACEISVLLRERAQYENLGDAQYIDHFVYASESKIGQKAISAYKKYSSSSRYEQRSRKKHRAIANSGNQKAVLKYSLIEYLKSVLTVSYSEYTPRSYCHNALRELNKAGLSYDVVISSFGPAASHYIGRKIKEKNPELVWIADYRDPLAIGESTKGFLHGWALNFAKRVTGKADAITVASKGFTRCLNLEDENRVHVITNGFDSDDYAGIVVGKNVPHSKMKIAYTGTLFAGSRDISVIFTALKELIEEGKIDQNRIEIVYAGQHKNEFLFQYYSSGLAVAVEANDVIPKKDALKLQNSSDLLLLAAWNTSEYQGSLPLKVFEYLYVGKPIICSICGTSANSELKQIIDYCKAGVCYEEANHKEDFHKLKESLYLYYLEFIQHGYISSRRNESKIEQYDYKRIAESFYLLMDKNNRNEHCN